MADHTLNGKNVLIAGGAKNLGGLVAVVAEAGANVAIHYNSDSSRRGRGADAGRRRSGWRQGRGVSGGPHELLANVAELFADAEAALGTIDVAVNTAGKVLRKPIVETTEDEYDSMFDINSKAAYFFIQEAGKNLADGGKIITIVTALLAAFTDGYSTYAGGKSPVSTSLAPRPRSSPARHLRHRDRARSHGHAVLLRPGDPGAGRVPQVAGYGRSAHEDRGHRPDRPLPRLRGLVDHRPDDLRQRRLHHPLSLTLRIRSAPWQHPPSPNPVPLFITAVNDHDESFPSTPSAPDGTVDDWGRDFTGREQIKTWSTRSSSVRAAPSRSRRSTSPLARSPSSATGAPTTRTAARSSSSTSTATSSRR